MLTSEDLRNYRGDDWDFIVSCQMDIQAYKEAMMYENTDDGISEEDE